MKDNEKGLKAVICEYFAGHGQRVTMLSKLILALIQMRTVNFAQLALVINAGAKVGSNFKWIQRFMKQYVFDQERFVRFAWSQYGDEGSWIVLSMDRTNWQFGKMNINILTLGISWRGTAIPLVWKLLNKKGQSNVSERIALLDELLCLLTQEQRSKIHYVIMDREFGSGEWITALKKRSLGFIIRIRVDARVRKAASLKDRAAKELFVCPYFKVLRKPRVVFGHRLFIGGQQLSEKEFLILVSANRLEHRGRLYAERWGIEVFFGCCKSRGFNFEDTHLTKLERINTLTYLLALAFIWAFKMGEFLIHNGHQIPINKLKDRKTKLYSIFRWGLDHIRHRILNFMDLAEEFLVLSCT